MPRILSEVLKKHWIIYEAMHKETIREMCRKDLFFLLRFICGRKDMEQQWLLDRCDEVEDSPNGHLDLWARDHYKSTIITFGKTLQDMLTDPEITIVFYSYTRPAAKAFLRQIKRELENNIVLKATFSDILWAEPEKEAPSWSEDNGLCLRRKSNPKENTLEAFGLVDGQPTGRHYRLRIYDDVVVREGVNSPEMRLATITAWENSLNTGMRGGVMRLVGTPYHYADAWAVIRKKGSVKVRTYPVKDKNGVLAMLTPEEDADKMRDMGSVVYATQMMLDPSAQSSTSMKRTDLRFYHEVQNLHGNIYILCDPASTSKKRSDYTVMIVIMLCADLNYYVIDILRDRLNLSQRWKALLRFHRKYRPIKILYEKFGKDSDIEHFESMMEHTGYRFEITQYNSNDSKENRIAGLGPDFENHRIYLPHKLYVLLKETNKEEDMIEKFIEEEYTTWPYCEHDDMLDCLAQMKWSKAGLEWPMAVAQDFWRQPGQGAMIARGTGEVVEM